VRSLLPLQITEPVSSGKCGKMISYGFKWAFCYQFFAAGALLNWISHIFWLKSLKQFFAIKEQVLNKLKNKISLVQC
jgi:hypothetical protein